MMSRSPKPAEEWPRDYNEQHLRDLVYSDYAQAFVQATVLPIGKDTVRLGWLTCRCEGSIVIFVTPSLDPASFRG